MPGQFRDYVDGMTVRVEAATNDEAAAAALRADVITLRGRLARPH